MRLFIGTMKLQISGSNTTLPILAVFLFMRCAGSKTVHVTWVRTRIKLLKLELKLSLALILYLESSGSLDSGRLPGKTLGYWNLFTAGFP